MAHFDFLVIGGGAAGFFAAINTIQKKNNFKVGIIEKQTKFLQKVKVSGGGRCNVTNAIEDPIELSKNYPRGQEFLQKPFQNFNTSHTKLWFEKRGVKLKTEKDGRVFPISDSSQTIIDCFLKEAKNVELILGARVENFEQSNDGWEISLSDRKILTATNLMIASGSDKRIWEVLKKLDLKINEQVPSLFTFNIPDPELHNLQGVSFLDSTVSIKKSDLKQQGPLLITHWGLSGPGILKLSAWGAYLLKDRDYKFDIEVNWLGKLTAKQIETELKNTFQANPKKNIRSLPILGLTQRFWTYICDKSNIGEFQKGAESGKKQIAALCTAISSMPFKVDGKSTFKEEFVTAGGVDLDEIDAEKFCSKRFSNLYFGGEVLNIDAITGGFNFQAAWTGAWHIAEDISSKKI